MLGLLAALAGATSCRAPDRGVEPSEAFRVALDEVMARQPQAERVRPDVLPERREPVVLRMSLDDCLELAAAHNRSILFKQLDQEIARADVMSARSNLDFTVGANFSYSREQKEVQARFLGDSRDKDITATTTTGISATMPFATGTTLELAGSFVRSDSNSPFQSFEFYPSASAKVTQHLLNGFGFVPNLGGAWIAEGNEAAAGYDLSAARNEQAYTVAVAYWDLVAAQEDLEVLRKQEDLARDALELAKDRLEAELGTRLDVLAQESNLAAQQRSIIQAEALVEQRTDELLYAVHPDLLHGYALFEHYHIVIEPETRVDTTLLGQSSPSLVHEVRGALGRRPEIQAAIRQVENAGVSVRMADYSLLPSLDIEAELAVNGYGENTNDSVESFTDLDNTRWGIGLVFSVPLQNRAARAGRETAEANRRIAILNAREVETGVILEVASAVRQIESARKGVIAAQEAARLADETYRAERERQEAELATAFEVKQAFNDLTAAERDLVAARIDLEKARLALLKASGELGR